MGQYKWMASDGQELLFQVCQYDGAWNDVSGVYLFCCQDVSGRLTLLYAGQADSFKKRFVNHHKWPEAFRLGATIVLAAVVSDARRREVYERELIAQFDPLLNEKLNSPAAIAKTFGIIGSAMQYPTGLLGAYSSHGLFRRR